jgi:hypothetical protein
VERAAPPVRGAVGGGGVLRFWSSRHALLVLWIVTRAVLLVVSLNPRLYSAGLFGDVRLYGAKVERMFQGELPYRDVAIEYPPGSVPFTILPALAVGTGAGYRAAFAVEMLAVDGLGCYAAIRLARLLDAGRRRIPLAWLLAPAVVAALPGAGGTAPREAPRGSPAKAQPTPTRDRCHRLLVPAAATVLSGDGEGSCHGPRSIHARADRRLGPRGTRRLLPAVQFFIRVSYAFVPAVALIRGPHRRRPGRRFTDRAAATRRTRIAATANHTATRRTGRPQLR